jgi:Protein of unknown function (DUF3147)
MTVKFQLSALSQTRWYELVLRVLCGGIATVLTGLIAKSFGPVVGGLFLAFPAIFPSTASLVEKHVKEKRLRAGLDGSQRAAYAVAIEARGATVGSVGLLMFAALTVWFLPLMPVAPALSAATSGWLGISVLCWELRRWIR